MTWFKNWFNSPFYHKLYKNRDFNEAEIFIENLFDFLKIEKGKNALDLACGKGRHSIKLNQLGLITWGCDLSEESILEAKKIENETLKFFEHDMRKHFENLPKMDYIFNLFTSFGYFESEIDNINTLMNVKNCLNRNGFFVQDFFNSNKIIKNLKDYEEKIIDNTLFRITKKLENNFIIKIISFDDEQGKNFNFEEKVEAISLKKFQEFYKQVGLKIIDIKGDYHLNEYNTENSDRLILISQPI